MKLIMNLEADAVPSPDDPQQIQLENQRFRYQIDGSLMEPTDWCLPVAVVEVPDSTGLDWRRGESVTVRLNAGEVHQVPQLDGDRWVLLGLSNENFHLRSIDAKNIVDHAKAGHFQFRLVEHYLSP